jgi:hypothetical protein
MRVYKVTLTPEPLDGDPVDNTLDSFDVEVPLRYHPALADLLPAMSQRAKEEAQRRAVKLERMRSKTDDARVFTPGDVKLLRHLHVEARAGRGAPIA